MAVPGDGPAVKHRVTGAVPNIRSLPYRLLAGDAPRVLTSLALVKPRDRAAHPQLPRFCAQRLAPWGKPVNFWQNTKASQDELPPFLQSKGPSSWCATGTTGPVHICG